MQSFGVNSTIAIRVDSMSLAFKKVRGSASYKRGTKDTIGTVKLTNRQRHG